MKLNSDNAPVIIGISMILSVFVGLSLIIATFLDNSDSKAQEAEENIYSHNTEEYPQEENIEKLVVPSQNSQGTGVPIESDESLNIGDYADTPAAISSSGSSYSSSTNDLLPQNYDRDTRSLSSQSLTRSSSIRNSSSTGSYSSSQDSSTTDSMSSESLVDSIDEDTSLDSTSSGFSDRDDSLGIDPLSEDSQF